MSWELVAKILGVLALLGGWVVAYHRYDQGHLEASMANVEAGVVAQRIQNIYAAKCSFGGLSPDLQAILREQLERYHSLTGREFTAPDC